MSYPLHFETLQVHAGQEKADSATGALHTPIYQTTSYVFSSCDQAEARFALKESGNIYGRLTNPTQDVLEKRMAALEGGVGALALASGAAAVTYALQNITTSGDHIVASRSIYGGTYNLLAHTIKAFGLETTFVDQDDLPKLEQAIRENTKAIFVETMSNPNSDLTDLEKVASIARRHKLPLIVDNTFATPCLIRPIEYGANIVVHSATKFLGGHGSSLGGIVVDGGNFDWASYPLLNNPNPSYHNISFTKTFGSSAYIARMRAILLRDMGAAISPFNCALILQGLETLSLRVERSVENALYCVDFLKNHPRVERVLHPSLTNPKLYQRYFKNGAGSIFTFEIKGTASDARRIIDRLHLFSCVANVGDVRSLVIHPASTTHAQMTHEELLACGIRENSIRLSLGIEHKDDLIQDLEQALSL